MFNTNAQCYQNISQVLLTSAFTLWPTCTRGFGIQEKIRCGFRFFGVFLCGFAVFGSLPLASIRAVHKTLGRRDSTPPQLHPPSTLSSNNPLREKNFVPGHLGEIVAFVLKTKWRFGEGINIKFMKSQGRLTFYKDVIFVSQK